jgi:hypothetical protein
MTLVLAVLEPLPRLDRVELRILPPVPPLLRRINSLQMKPQLYGTLKNSTRRISLVPRLLQHRTIRTTFISLIRQPYLDMRHLTIYTSRAGTL